MTQTQTRARRGALALAMAAAVAAPAALSATASAQEAPPAPAIEGFAHLATHPGAAAQPEYARSIDAMAISDGELIAGYGDYSANTGPITLNPLDLATGQFTGVEATLAGEEILVFREVDGDLYAPNIDPRTRWNDPTGFATDRGGSWAEERHVPFVHVYDVASRVPGEMWMAGSANVPDGSNAFGGATLYKSLDGGLTWELERQETDANQSDRTGFERYYWIGSAGGKLLMQAHSVKDAPIRVYDGKSWSTVNKLPKGWMGGWSTSDGDQVCNWATDPAMVGRLGDDLMVCNGYGDLRTREGATVTFDGTTLTRHLGTWAGGQVPTGTSGSYMLARVTDWYEGDDGWLYALAPAKGVARTQDGATFEVLVDRPVPATSLAVADGLLYLGGDQAAIHVSELTVEEMAAAVDQVVSPTSAMSTKVGKGGGNGNGNGNGNGGGNNGGGNGKEKGPDHPSNQPGKGKGKGNGNGKAEATAVL